MNNDKKHKIFIYSIVIIVCVIVLLYVLNMIITDDMFDFIFPKSFDIKYPKLHPIEI